MIIKCGISDAGNVDNVVDAGARLIGLNFCTDSSCCLRMVNSGTGIFPDYAVKRFKDCGPDVLPWAGKALLVGIFDDDMPQNIVTRIYNYGLDYVQLNGNESRTMIENLLNTIVPDIAPALKIIKTVAVRSKNDFGKCRSYEGIVDLFLFVPCKESRCDETYDVLFDGYEGDTPFLLGGKIFPDDVEKMLDINHKMFVGIDIGDGFETADGMKDVDGIRRFVSRLCENK